MQTLWFRVMCLQAFTLKASSWHAGRLACFDKEDGRDCQKLSGTRLHGVPCHAAKAQMVTFGCSLADERWWLTLSAVALLLSDYKHRHACESSGNAPAPEKATWNTCVTCEPTLLSLSLVACAKC